MEIKELLKEFKLDMEIKGYSNETIRRYVSILKLFEEYLEKVLSITQVEDLKSVHLKAYAKFNKDRGLKIKSRNSHISGIRAFFKFLLEEEIIERDFSNCLKMTNPTDTRDIYIFNNEEIKKLSNYKRPQNEYYKSKFLSVRDPLIINFLIETGCRNHELHSLKTEDVKDGFIHFKTTKGSKPRVVPYSNKLKKMMLRYEREKLKRFPNDTEYYFASRTGGKMYNPNVSTVVKTACSECGIDPIKAYPHNFRHTFAVMTLKNTNDIYLVSKLLGHCNVSITEIYLQGLTNTDIITMMKHNTILDNI